MAKSLINGLASERENWKVDLAKNRENRLNVVGDVIIASCHRLLGCLLEELQR